MVKKNDYGAKKFRTFARNNRLRLKKGEDGVPIVVSRGAEYKGCHLFEGFGDNHVGLYVTRQTPFKTTCMHNVLKKSGLKPICQGETESTFKVPYSRVMTVAKKFKMIKRKFKKRTKKDATR